LRLLCIVAFVGTMGQIAYADEAQDQDADTVVAIVSPTQIIYDSATRYGVSGVQMYRIISCETQGFTKLEGDFVHGRPTSYGWVQLNEGGLLGTFYRMGYSDPYSLSQASDFMAYELSIGNRRAWHCPG
jgi:hypothetical protein